MTEPRRRTETDLPPPGEGATGRAVVIVPHLRENKTAAAAHLRSPQARLEEAIGLARAIDLDVVGSGLVPLTQIRPATYIGTGKVEELAGLVLAEEAGLVVVDTALSPVQQRNLEKAWNCKVLDRTGLILEIFGRRARTKEGALQVELAHLNWQKSRLVRSWTHLERQRGGFGFLGGPGETQIESDRRVIGERIHKIERELDQVRRTRGLHRSSRKRVPYPIVALVGYTNAGKSTLFNRLTGAEILAKDMLFATLDPTLRRVRLPHGEEIILSDTVGFISDLPTMLVAAFRATLEEVLEADIILHVRDIATPETQQQAEDVKKVLGELGIHPGEGRRILEVWNKVDQIEPSQREPLKTKAAAAEPSAVLVSAMSGEGVPDLLAAIERALMGGRPTVTVEFGSDQLGAVPWLYENAEVLERSDDPETGRARLRVRVSEKRLAPFREWAQREHVSVAASDGRKGA